jgi:hypothetical protein
MPSSFNSRSKTYKAATALFISAILFALLYYGCKKKDKPDPEADHSTTGQLAALLPVHSRETGLRFASDATAILINRPSLAIRVAGRLNFDKSFVEEHMAATPVHSYTEDQRRVLWLIIQSIKECKSTEELLGKQLDIARKVPAMLKAGEREKIYDVLASLHYGLLGVTSFKATTTVSYLIPPIANYPSILYQMWQIALIEPSPVGEIIAFLITVGFVAWYVYSKQMCIDAYVWCVQHTNLNCNDCFRFCEGQGVWRCPPY